MPPGARAARSAVRKGRQAARRRLPSPPPPLRRLSVMGRRVGHTPLWPWPLPQSRNPAVQWLLHWVLRPVLALWYAAFYRGRPDTATFWRKPEWSTFHSPWRWWHALFCYLGCGPVIPGGEGKGECLAPCVAPPPCLAATRLNRMHRRAPPCPRVPAPVQPTLASAVEPEVASGGVLHRERSVFGVHLPAQQLLPGTAQPGCIWRHCAECVPALQFRPLPGAQRQAAGRVRQASAPRAMRAHRHAFIRCLAPPHSCACGSPPPRAALIRAALARGTGCHAAQILDGPHRVCFGQEFCAHADHAGGDADG